MKQFILTSLACLALQTMSFGQQITGAFTALPNQTIKLQGFDDFETYVIDSTQTDAQGKFKLSFATKNEGIGLLQTSQEKPLIVILTNENIVIQGEAPSIIESIKINEGKRNQAFVEYATQQPKREQVLSAWTYLEKRYKTEDLFSGQIAPQKAVNEEIERLNNEEKGFLASLPKDSYLRWLLPIRKLVGSVSTVAQYHPEEITSTREALRNIDFTDNRLYKSGLLRETLENHIWFIENTSGGLENVYNELNTSIDTIIRQLKNDNDKFNLVTAKIFEILEKRSLFTSSEYLAKRLLKDDDCGCLNPALQKQLHKYGKMAKGAIAPDINFGEFTYYPKDVNAKKLSEVNADYYLVVFAASWCPHCTKAMPKIVDLYPSLKAKNIEVVLVSLDENTTDFAQFAAPLPFISTTDLKKWDSQAAQDYQVYSTPSYFMLDNDLKILMKLQSVEHIQSWIKLL